MADGVDWMDVQAMVEKAVQGEKWSRNRHIEDVEKDLRREFRNEVMALREEVGELVAELHKALRDEHEARALEVNAVYRVINERTEHLV